MSVMTEEEMDYQIELAKLYSNKNDNAENLYEFTESELSAHDEQIRAEERKKAFKEFVDLYREFCKAPNDESCLNEDIECEGMCIDCFEKWLTTKKQN